MPKKTAPVFNQSHSQCHPISCDVITRAMATRQASLFNTEKVVHNRERFLYNAFKLISDNHDNKKGKFI